jgi:hypothetical protein
MFYISPRLRGIVSVRGASIAATSNVRASSSLLAPTVRNQKHEVFKFSIGLRFSSNFVKIGQFKSLRETTHTHTHRLHGDSINLSFSSMYID